MSKWGQTRSFGDVRSMSGSPRKRISARHHGMSHELPRRHSRNAVLWNVGLEDHSGLMPANLITFAHFSVSSVMSFPKSWGEPASTVLPRSASRAFILGSLLRLLTISAGVPGQLRRSRQNENRFETTSMKRTKATSHTEDC